MHESAHYKTAGAAQSPDLSDFQTFRDFARDYERQKLGSEQSLRWLARYRDKNGLLSSGALVELKTPGATRPRLLVNRQKFAGWLASQSSGAAA